MARHDISWTKPAPFWSESTSQVAQVDHEEFRRPGILRFATDSFMDEFMNVLATDPTRLGEYRARPETWRGILPTTPPVAPNKAFGLPLQRLGFARKNLANGRPSLPTVPPADLLPVTQRFNAPLKLYQPVHQRHYLVTSCLVCRTPGLPDRHVDTAHQQRVGFLMRRIFVDTTDTAEYAWVSTPKGNFWQKLDSASYEQIATGEEVLSMFAVNFTADDLRKRRLFAGNIPVGKREAYLGGAKSPTETAQLFSTKTARKILFRKDFAEPWKVLLNRAAEKYHEFASPPTEIPKGTTPSAEQLDVQSARLQSERDQIQMTSWFLLHDFLRFIKIYMKDLYDALDQTSVPSLPLESRNKLHELLGTLKIGPTLATDIGNSSVSSSMRDALKSMKPFLEAGTLDKIETSYTQAEHDPRWPTFLFPLADPKYPGDAPVPTPLLDISTDEHTVIDEANAGGDPSHLPPQPPPLPDFPLPSDVDMLTIAVIRALDDVSPAPEPEVPTSSITPGNALSGSFVIRCVYERPTCGPLQKDIVSPPSELFELAGFFDSDAPARPIRIGLPIDTSLAGLRKFDKNTAFVMSDMLCGQVKRMKGITLLDLILSLLPWPFHKDLSVPDKGPCGNGMGTICSLSIPIITLCALIVLMIMVALLDFVFKWMPFLMVCFPIPGLRAKKP
jgi:hypothetical protein